MMIMLSRHWWALALRGLCAVSFGVAALAWPHMTLAFLVVLYGCYAMADGIFSLVAWFASRGQSGFPVATFLEGVTGIGVGIFAFGWPRITALALLYLIAAWAVVVGTLELYVAYRLRSTIPGEWVLALAGGLSILLGATLAVAPDAGAVALIRLIGASALLLGSLFLILAWQSRRQWFRLLELSV